MVKAVTRFIANDGTQHETEQEALDWECRSDVIRAINSVMFLNMNTFACGKLSNEDLDQFIYDNRFAFMELGDKLNKILSPKK